MWLRKGHFKREAESLLIVKQNNAIKTNHAKARVYKTQQTAYVVYVVIETKRLITYSANAAD